MGSEFVYRKFIVSWEDETGAHWCKVTAVREEVAKLTAAKRYAWRVNKGLNINALMDKMSVRVAVEEAK